MVNIRGLTFSYENKPIFENFDADISTGFAVIKGPSGCGKTTLLKLLTGNLIPKGTVKSDEFKKNTLILQEDALFPWMTGMDNILKILSITEDEVKKHPLYKHVESFIRQRAYEMSFGQRRMIELFRAFLYKPDFLCLDEPFNFLDPVNRKRMLDFILPASGFLPNTTIIMSTHYSEDTSGLGLETYYFDGNFPVRKLLTEAEFKKHV